MTLIIDPFTPVYPDTRRRKIVFCDDFVGSNYANKSWAVYGTGSVTKLDALGGQVRIRGNNNVTYNFLQDGLLHITPSKNVYIEWRASLVPPSGGAAAVGCLGDIFTSADNYVRISYDRGGGSANFMCMAMNSSQGFVSESSGVTANTAFHRFGIEIATGYICYFIDNVSVYKRVANIPETNQQLHVVCDGGGGSSDAILDYVYVSYDY